MPPIRTSCQTSNFPLLKVSLLKKSAGLLYSKEKFFFTITTCHSAILMHGVGFFDNPGLCYAPFMVNWDDILEYPDLQPVILVPMNSRSATTHWITACATRHDSASRASTHATTPPYFVDTGDVDHSTPSRLPYTDLNYLYHN